MLHPSVFFFFFAIFFSFFFFLGTFFIFYFGGLLPSFSGLMVEYYPATVEIGVRFPAEAHFLFIFQYFGIIEPVNEVFKSLPSLHPGLYVLPVLYTVFSLSQLCFLKKEPVFEMI